MKAATAQAARQRLAAAVSRLARRCRQPGTNPPTSWLPTRRAAVASASPAAPNAPQAAIVAADAHVAQELRAAGFFHHRPISEGRQDGVQDHGAFQRERRRLLVAQAAAADAP